MRITWAIAVVVLVAIVLPAEAAMPVHNSDGYPDTFWARMGYTTTVTGKVITSSSTSTGIEGAYVAIVNASNPGEVYAHTMSDSRGNYSFSNVSAIYYQTPDRFDPQYMVYANAPGYGEAYSQAFRIDAGSVSQPYEMWVVIPVNATPSPTSIMPTITTTPMAIPSPSIAPVITHASSDGSFSLWNLAIYAVVILVVLAAAGVYLYIRRR